MRSKYLKLFFLLLPVLLLTACSEEPSTVGINQLNNDLVDIKDYDSQSDTIKQTSSLTIRREAYQNSYRVLLGATAEDGLSSSIYYRFDYYNSLSGLDSIKALFSQDSARVIKAYMKLYPVYAYPTSGYTNFDFDVFRINTNWYAYGLTIDSVNRYLPPSTIGTTSIKTTTPVMQDSLMYFEIDNNTAFAMIKAETDADTSTHDYGFVLKPNSGSKKIIGFSAYGAYSNAPQLSVIIECKKYNDYYIDTLTFSPASDVHVFETGAAPSNLESAGYFAVRGGLSVQTLLTFNLNRADGSPVIPANAVINSAELILKPDYTKSKIQDTNYVSLYSSCIGIDSASSAALSTAPIVVAKSGDYYSGNITYFVQRWLKAGYNKGMYLSLASGGMSCDLFTFAGSNNSKVADRPRLKITYTVKK